MVVLREYKIVWSSVPRTGTLSMLRLLKHFKGILVGKFHRHTVPEKYKDYTRFMLVRNPYDRLLSWWRWWQNHDSRIPIQSDETFEEFLIWLIKNRNAYGKDYCYCCDSQAAFSHAFKCNIFLYLDKLPEDFKKVSKLRNAHRQWYNAAAHKQEPVDVMSYYGPKELELAHEHSGEDFKEFNFVQV